MTKTPRRWCAAMASRASAAMLRWQWRLYLAAVGQESQKHLRRREAAEADGEPRNSGADPARRLCRAGREERRRVASAGARFPRNPQILGGSSRWRRGVALCATRRGHARSHHPHQEHPAVRARARCRRSCGLPRGGAPSGAGFRCCLSRLFPAQQRRPRPEEARARSCRASRSCPALVSSAWGAARRTQPSLPISPRTRC